MPMLALRRTTRRSGRALGRLAQGAAAFALTLALALPVALTAQSEMPESPYSQYLTKSEVDKYNPDVKTGKVGTPKRGGRLRVRTPADAQGLNPLTVTGQPERVVLNHMSDALVDQDLETFEEYPVLAWTWRIGDLVKKQGEDEPMTGRIVERKENGDISFVPDAWVETFNRYDVASFDVVKGELTLSAERGNRVVRGKIQQFPSTLRVETAWDPEILKGRVEIASAELATWDDLSSGERKVRPYVKESCVFEFYIRDGVTWHDGAKFTAEDIKFTLDTIKNPNTDCAHIRAYYQDVYQYETFNDGMAIRCFYDRPFFAAIGFVGFALGTRNVIPKHIFNPEQFGGDAKAFADSFNKHPFNKRPILTGPYKLREWKENQFLTLERNEDYWASKLPKGAIHKWDPVQPYFDEITQILIQDKNAALLEVQKQEIDVDLDVEPDIWMSDTTTSTQFTDNTVRAHQLGFLYTYIGWNLEREYFQDKNTRRALAMLIPRERICREIHQNVGRPHDGPYYPLSPAYDKTVEPVPYDPRGAQQLLKRAGWADRDRNGILEKTINGKTVEFRFKYLIHNAREYHQKIADIIKESIEAANIGVEIEKLDWTIYSDTVRDKKFDSVRFAWGANLDPDPYGIWHSSQIKDRGDNFVSFRNDRVDRLCEMIREEFDPLKRWEMARELHRIIADEQPYCFLESFDENYFINRKIQGVKLYPSSYVVNFSEWYWAGEPPRGAQVQRRTTAGK